MNAYLFRVSAVICENTGAIVTKMVCIPFDRITLEFRRNGKTQEMSITMQVIRDVDESALISMISQNLISLMRG